MAVPNSQAKVLASKALLFAAASLMVFNGALDAKSSYQLYKNHGPQQPSNQKSQRADAGPSYGDLQHEIENHELEIRMLEERLNAQETILDALREELRDASHSQQQTLKGNTVTIEKRVGTIEKGVSGIGNDIRELQTHANDTAKNMAQYKQKLLDLEKQIAVFQNALDTLFAALQIDGSGKQDTAKVYEVKPGDKLEKIARSYNTSVKEIKELNSLSNDRIYVGQKLKIP